MNPLDFVSVMQPLLGFIMAAYLIIAAQFGYEASKIGVADDAVRAMLLLVAIFVLCAVCGYGLRAIQPGVLVAMCLENPLPPVVIILLHASLAFASGVYILTGQAGVIMRRFQPRPA